MTESPQHKPMNRSEFPSKIFLPDLSSYVEKVFALKLNPHWHEAEAGSYAWLDSYGIHSAAKRKSFFEHAFGLMASLSFPNAELELLRPATDFILWLFAFDDMTDELEGELRDSVEALKTAIDITMDCLRNPESPPPNLRIAASLHSFFNRMRASASPATIQRFVDATDYYTRAILQQTVNRSADQVPTVEEFIQLRRDTSAVKMVFAVAEYSLGLDLPEEVHSDPIVTELAEAGNDILTWANDVYSFPIELANGDTQNLVFIAMSDKRLDLEGAMNFVGQLIQKRVQGYMATKGHLRSFGPALDDKVALYIQNIEHIVRGTIHWAFTTPRYFGADVEKVRETGIVDIMVPSGVLAGPVDATN